MITPYAPMPGSNSTPNTQMGTSKVGVYNTKGDGFKDTFFIPHGMTTVPKYANATAKNEGAVGNYSVTWDNTNVMIVYSVAPNGDNLAFNWIAVP